jgi:hypothetical protein
MAEQRELAQEGKVVRGVARVPPHAAQLRAREQLSARADQQKERGEEGSSTMRMRLSSSWRVRRGHRRRRWRSRFSSASSRSGSESRSASRGLSRRFSFSSSSSSSSCALGSVARHERARREGEGGGEGQGGRPCAVRKGRRDGPAGRRCGRGGERGRGRRGEPRPRRTRGTCHAARRGARPAASSTTLAWTGASPATVPGTAPTVPGAACPWLARTPPAQTTSRTAASAAQGPTPRPPRRRLRRPVRAGARRAGTGTRGATRT